MILLMIYFILSKLSCLQIMQMKTHFPMQIKKYKFSNYIQNGKQKNVSGGLL